MRMVERLTRSSLSQRLQTREQASRLGLASSRRKISITSSSGRHVLIRSCPRIISKDKIALLGNDWLVRIYEKRVSGNRWSRRLTGNVRWCFLSYAPGPGKSLKGSEKNKGCLTYPSRPQLCRNFQSPLNFKILGIITFWNYSIVLLCLRKLTILLAKNINRQPLKDV
jgi:hypothetical protein